MERTGTSSFTESWYMNLQDILNFGQKISPRGMETKEIEDSIIYFDMKFPILNVKERELGTAFLCAEPYWILSGDNQLATIKPFAPMMERFSDDGTFLSGAYGPKIVDQLPYVIGNLEKDPNSRQAIISIWREKPGDTKDCPCTVLYQFRIRNNLLNMTVFMRSNDIWLGTPYDVFTQTMVAYAVCILLRKKYPDLKLGILNLFVGSLHLYSSQYEIVSNIIKGGFEAGKEISFDYTLSFEDLKEYLKSCAQHLYHGLEVKYGFLKGLQPKGSTKGIMV